MNAFLTSVKIKSLEQPVLEARTDEARSLSITASTPISPPSKPIGPFYTEEDARKLMKTRHWAMKDDSGRGWRRLVPSPAPVEIVEKGRKAIQKYFERAWEMKLMQQFRINVI